MWLKGKDRKKVNVSLHTQFSNVNFVHYHALLIPEIDKYKFKKYQKCNSYQCRD